MRTLFSLVLLFGLTVAGLEAQWPKSSRKDVPRKADGSINLDAPAPRMPDGRTPDFSGIWMTETVPCEKTPLETFGCSDTILGVPIGAIHIAATGEKDIVTGRPLPYLPWALELFQQNLKNNQVNSPQARCLPTSPPQQWADFNPQKIVQSRNELVLLSEWQINYRQIFLDGRALPVDAFPAFKGYSTGRWQGDTLVVESLGFKEGQWLDALGNPFTDSLRLTERIRRPSYGRLDVEIIITDPKAYTEPFTVHRHLKRTDDVDPFEYVCNENEKSLQRMLNSAK